MTRNLIVVAREHGKREMAWVRAACLAWVRDLSKSLLLERGRSARLAAVLRGVVDGARGRL